MGGPKEWSATFGVGDYDFAAFTQGGAENDATSALMLFLEVTLLTV